MNVTVLGGSNGAFATAADLALAGHHVRWWRRAEGDLAAVRDGITLVGEGRQGLAKLDHITTDSAEALDGAELIVAPVPATAHDDLAKRLGPLLTERQIVLLTPGTFGTFAMARELARAGGRLPFAFAETGTLPYLARKTGPVEVKAPVRATNLPTGVFPAARTEHVLAKLAPLFPVRRCVDALDAALTNVGAVIHPPLVLLNAGAIDSGRFDLHAEGTTASVRRLIDAVDEERLATRRGWGYPAPHYDMAATYYDEPRAAEGLYGAGAKAKLVASGLWNETLSLEHRYVTEDAALGLSLFESAARTATTAATPAISGLLLVFGVLLGRELAGHGRALEALGLGDLAPRDQDAVARRVGLSDVGAGDPMTNAILAELTDDGGGRLSYRGARYLLIRPETLAALQHALEAALGAGADECLVAGGRAGGGQATALFTGAGRERVEALLAMGSKIGWGRFVLERFAPDALVVTVTGSPFAEAYGPSRVPVCHLTRGVLEGLGSSVLTGRPRVTETACVAMGAPACRFETRVA